MKKSRPTRKWWGKFVCSWSGAHKWSSWRRNGKRTLASRWCLRCPTVQRQATQSVSGTAK